MRTQHILIAMVVSLSVTLISPVLLAAPDPKPDQAARPQQQQGRQQHALQQAARTVDLVIALDTSSSMDGLIDGARQKLWDVVNLLAHAKPQPVLRVGLLSYGNDGYDAHGGWVRKESDLTTDLDSVYDKLFALHTNGGTEYVARAVRNATSDLNWTGDPKALKIIFVAGNEPATQDPKISLESALGDARQKGIFVNAIYCGTEASSEAATWHRVASLGRGQYASIDQNQAVAIAAPQDAELARLSQELNQTYVAYGAAGRARAQNQAAQDRNAAKVSAPAAATRAVAKAGALYRNDEWDLVDAKAAGKDITKVDKAELPEPLQALNVDERKAYVEKKSKERDTIKQRIATLERERQGYIQTEQKKRAKTASKGLDDALDSAIRNEAKSAGFAF